MRKQFLLVALLGFSTLSAQDYWCLNRHISIRADYTYLRRQDIRDLRLVEEEPTVPGVKPRKVMDTDTLTDRLGWESGVRAGLTYHANACSSIEALYTYVFPWKAKVVRTGDQNLQFPFKDPFTGFDYRNASRVVGCYESRLQNGELNYLGHLTPQRCDYFSASWIIGFRSVYLREDFSLTFTRDFLNQISSSEYQIDTGNVLYGGQLGAMLEINPNSCFTWTFLIKGAGFLNVVKNELEIRDEDNSQVLKEYTKNSWTDSWLLEGYGQLAYHFSNSLSFHFAYQGYILTGLVLAPEQRDTSMLSRRIKKKGQIVIDGLYAGMTWGF